MRLAVLADIHGNIPALDKALEEIDKIGVEGIIVAGDMVAGPQPEEVVNRLRSLGCWMIRGNNEDYLLKLESVGAPEWWHTTLQFAFTRWNHRQMSEGNITFLKSLPEQAVIALPDEEPIRVVHGSPRSISELVYPDVDISKLDLALDTVPENVLVFGHTHQPWQVRRKGKLALNPGSVSGTLNGRLGGSYASLTSEEGQWRVELHNLQYDISLVRKAFEESGLLQEGGVIAEHWLYDIENGINTLPRFVEYAYQLSAEAGHAELPYVPDEIWEKAVQTFLYRI